MLVNAYPTHSKHADAEVKEMTLDPVAIKMDLKGLIRWTEYLALGPTTEPNYELFCDRSGRSPADENRIRTVMQLPRAVPTCIYLSGHTEHLDKSAEHPNERLGYAPADYLNTSSSGQYKVIAYEMMRQWLSNDLHLAPLLFITEVCECDNFLRLPYMLEYEGDEPRWEKTEYYEDFTQKSGDIVHFAATSPSEFSITFPKTGSFFTKAFCNDNINPSKPLSLSALAKQLNGNLGALTAWANIGDKPAGIQRPRVYCSRVMDESHFYEALGFYPSSGPGSSVGSDDDSNA